jgi:SAM-dependent methyltransferase
MLRFLELLAPPAGEPILDVGGSPEIWQEVGYDGPIVFLNIVPPDERTVLPPGCTFIQGDGRTLPFETGEFAVVFSNSVIEHVGTWEDQFRFAAEIQRVGRQFWVQTPNRRFPLEPHMNFPAFQWLPAPIAKAVVAMWPLSYHRRDGLSTQDAWEAVRNTRLVTVAEMRRLFPSATIWHERVLGLTKSVVAYRT